MSYEVERPILNSPYAEPAEHWYIREGEAPSKIPGRRPALVFEPSEGNRWDVDPSDPTLRRLSGYENAYELSLVNLVRARVAEWRSMGYPGASRTTTELLDWWRRPGRDKLLFFAQLEAAETIIFLKEARADLLQGIAIPTDDPSLEAQAQGYAPFERYACKMATGTGKTTVMAMVAAWSILNKAADRTDGRFSDVVLVVCPNITIRNRLQELDPRNGDASLYVTRDLVPRDLLPTLSQGRVLVTNWHVFAPQTAMCGPDSGRVLRTGVPQRTRETILIGAKTTTARGNRYLALDDYTRQVSAGIITVLSEERDGTGALRKAVIESVKYIESDTALLKRVLGREIGGKGNVLVMNDEAHHAYRIPKSSNGDDEGEDEDDEYDEVEATVWVDGLDTIHRRRGINFCVDFSATPYFLSRVGAMTTRPFPWIVSDFGLIDAIESGLVKIPQLAIRDTTGMDIPGYRNIWNWVLPKLTASERGARGTNPKPEAILKYAAAPIQMLAGLWEETRQEWATRPDEMRPPVFIVVCKNTRIAKVVHEWLSGQACPQGIPPAGIEGFLNTEVFTPTIRVDTKVVHETDSEGAKGDEMRWMRLTLDTVGRTGWPRDQVGRPIYPEGFEELAAKLARPLYPPGRDVRCIVSVGMLTEGWDANTVTHVIGLRPFQSQLLCEQVVGRPLRRPSYEIDDGGKFTEEVAKVFGVPFEVVPFKANSGTPPPPPPPKHHVHAVPEKAGLAITFPRVDGYTQAIRNRVTIDWATIPRLILDPLDIPPEVDVKASLPSNAGRPTLSGPGRLERVDMNPFRRDKRVQELVFDLASAITRQLVGRPGIELPAHVLFPQVARLVDRYVRQKVVVKPPAEIRDLFTSPYYGMVEEVLREHIRPDVSQGETPEVPRYDSRGPGSTADVDFWTRRDVREVVKSHVNFVVADTKVWEQSAAYFLDSSLYVAAFVKNAELGFEIYYFHDGQRHPYLPDFIVRLAGAADRYLILEPKGYDTLEEFKIAAAVRWVEAVNADGSYGVWHYAIAKDMTSVPEILARAHAAAPGEVLIETRLQTLALR